MVGEKGAGEWEGEKREGGRDQKQDQRQCGNVFTRTIHRSACGQTWGQEVGGSEVKLTMQTTRSGDRRLQQYAGRPRISATACMLSILNRTSNRRGKL